jgi:UDP-glucose 4-epimerase
MLGFEATTSLETMLDEVIPWITQAVENGTL